MGDASRLEALAERVASFESLRESDTGRDWTSERALFVLGRIAAFGHGRWLSEMTASIGIESGDAVTAAWVTAGARLRAELERGEFSDDAARVSALDQYAALSMAMGDAESARDALHAACAHVASAWGSRHGSMPGRLAQLASAHARLDAWREAESALRESMLALRHEHGAPPAEVLDALETLVAGLRRTGQHDTADRIDADARRELSARMGADAGGMGRRDEGA